MKREVAIRNAHPRLKLDRRAVARAIALLDAHAADFLGGCPPGELSLAFLTDPTQAKIHGDFMADPTATDVITFEGDPAAGLAGEICVSADTAARYVGLLEGPRLSAKGLATADPCGPVGMEGSAPAEPRPSRSRALQKTRRAGTRALQESFSAELTLYVVHGWLHLAGYDDLQPAKKRRMRAAEARAMKLLRAAKAMPVFRLA